MKTPTMFVSVQMLAAVSVALFGCGRNSSHPINIAYQPVGICRAYETRDGRINAGASNGFAVFKIESLDNTEGELDFVFAPERLFVNQSPPVLVAGTLNRRFVRADPRFARALGFAPVPEIPLAVGEKREVNSIVYIPLAINDLNGGAEANQFSFELAYDTGFGDKGDQENVNEGVSFTIIKPANPKWAVVENCRELAFK